MRFLSADELAALCVLAGCEQGKKAIATHMKVGSTLRAMHGF